MAKSTITLKEARSDLRSRLANITQSDILDEELRIWLNQGQKIVFTRLIDVIGHWYADDELTSGLAPVASTVTKHALIGNYAPNLIARIISVVGYDATDLDLNNLVFQPVHSINELYSYLNDSNYNSNAAWYHNGEDLWYMIGSNIGNLTNSEFRLYVWKKPVDMANDWYYMDIPEEYTDYVIMAAQSKAMSKLNMIAEQRELEGSMSEMLNDIVRSYGVEVEQLAIKRRPGVQLPKGE